MSDRIRYLKLVLVLVLLSNATGCFAKAPAQTQIQSTEVKMQQNKLVTLSGVVLHKPAVKNAETWMAGGGDYYVLDVGNAQIEERSASVGFILRTSETVSSDRFAEYVGKPVEIEGEYVAAQPYTPQNSIESYPMDMNGKPLPTGAGFKVYNIKVGR